MKIWIVIGSTGEYEDYSEWNVAAYKRKKIAVLHSKLAQKEVDPMNKKIEDDNENFDYYTAVNKYDPKMSVDYTGTYYKVEPVEMPDIKTEEEFEAHTFLKEL